MDFYLASAPHQNAARCRTTCHAAHLWSNSVTPCYTTSQKKVVVQAGLLTLGLGRDGSLCFAHFQQLPVQSAELVEIAKDLDAQRVLHPACFHRIEPGG